MAFNSQPVRMMPPAGSSFTELPGFRYYCNGPQGVLPEHVAALEERGWAKVDRPPTPPPSPEAIRAQREAQERASQRPLSAPEKLARVIPPLTGSLVIEGRSYVSRNGAAFDAPAEDARIMAANGWLIFGLSGPLSMRPAQPRMGEIFVELPTEAVSQFDGRAWRDVRTGSVIA
jgi:hypothetical protein